MNPQMISAAAALLLLPLGVVTLLLGRRCLRRQETGRGKRYVIIGVLAVGIGAAGTWTRRDFLRDFFRGDVDDANRQAALQQAPLPSAPVAGDPTSWPQWRGVQRDGRSPATNLLRQWSVEAPRTVWRRTLGGGYSSPSIVGERLYVNDRQGDQERIQCLDAGNGNPRWEYRYPVDLRGQDPTYSVGPRASLTLHDQRLYSVGSSGLFLCLDAAPDRTEAKVLWQQDLLADFKATVPRWGVACSPLIEGELVIVQPGGSKGSIAAFDRKTGELAWTALDDASGYSSPVAGTCAGVRQVICFTGKRLVGLQPEDGKMLWEFPWATQYQANIATPIVAGDYVFVSSNYSAGCALLQLEKSDQGVQAHPVFVRRNKVMRNHFSTCVLHEGHLYGFDSSGGTSFLKCLDVRTFAEKWSTRDLGNGCLLVADGMLIVLNHAGQLALVEATPDEYRKLAERDVLQGGQVWALPALAGKRLYLRDNTQLLCLDLTP